MKPLLQIYVEGNISAGKSTLMDELAKDTRFSCFKEENGGRSPFLETFYKNMKVGSFALQTKILIDQLNYPSNPNTINVYERSPISLLHIFGKLLYEDGLFDDHEFLLHVEMVEKFSSIPKIIIYIDTPTEICYERKKVRRNAGTSDDMVPFKYMKELEKKHEDVMRIFASKIKIIRIHHNYSIECVKDRIFNAIRSSSPIS